MAEHYTDEDARQAEVVIGLGEGIDRDCKLCTASGRRGACPAHAARAVLDAVAPTIAARALLDFADSIQEGIVPQNGPHYSRADAEDEATVETIQARVAELFPPEVVRDLAIRRAREATKRADEIEGR